ncbi:MAG: NAD(P)H-hydrate epimerase, partial [Myxococcales bacterium]
MYPWTPTRIVSVEEMRALDRAASEHFAVPSVLLMENAGREVAEVARSRLGAGRTVVVFCGPGNNGGDGLVAARHLQNKGLSVEVLLLTEQMKGDAALNLEAFCKQGGSCHVFQPRQRVNAGPGDVVVDAIFGIGLSRPPTELALSAIQEINLARERGATVVAVDLPSGLNTDSGRPPGECVDADVTVTLGYIKRGLVLEPGSTLAGELVVADIGIPRRAESKLTERPVFMLTELGIRSMLPRRDASAHKGTFGHVLVLAGSPGKTGAAAMTCAAAL